MATAVRELWGALDAAERLPFGVERSALIESLVTEADATGDGKLALTARLLLMTSYSYGGEPLRRFPVFAWLLDRYTAEPQLFDEGDRYRLLWMFKWVTVGVTHHPAVPRNRIEARLEEMAEHFAAAGEGPAPVLGCRFQVEARMDGHAAAEEAYRAWTAAPRTALSDCEACEPGVRVWHLAATGRYADALEEAAGVLQLGGCADQPQRTIGHALEPLLQLGFTDRAGHEHLRGVRLLRARGGSPASWARHVLACARGGQLYRGLDLLEDRLPDLESAPTPWDAMWLAAAGGRLLRALELNGEGELAVLGLPAATPSGGSGSGNSGSGGRAADDAAEDVVSTVAQLLEQLTGRARSLATRFDERNGTDAVSSEVEQWLNSPPLPQFPLPDVPTRRRVPIEPRSGAIPLRPQAPAPDPAEVAALAVDWQAALDSGGSARREAVLRTWRLTRSDPQAASADPLLAARLEAALAIDDVDRGTASLHDARGAARLLREAGDPTGAWLHELACLRRELSAGATSAGVLSRARAVVAKGTAGGSRGAAACLHVGYVALLQVAGQPTGPAVAEGLAAVAGADPKDLSAVERGCLALLLRDRAGELSEPQRGELLQQAYDLLAPGERALERALVGLALGTSLDAAGSPSRAREVLAGAADDAETAGDEGLAVHTAHALGRACRLSGDVPAAVEVFRGVLAQLGAEHDPVLLAQARQDLALALRDTRDLVTAAELAETALDDLEHHLGQRGRTAPADLDWAALADRAATGALPDGTEAADHPDGTEAGAQVSATGEVAPGPGDVPGESSLAGTLAFTAALCARDLDEPAQATALACRSAAWHRDQGRAEAEAESLELAAHCCPDAREAAGLLWRAGELHARGGRWIAAATCRRALAMPLLEVCGLAAAERALARAQAALAGV
ncbi:MAG TPA: hypothetical protein VFP72_09820, partial [Kineosporiaceae bacterium]|nr:hypothetical protein [Kineosporiaceae bacterium]